MLVDVKILYSNIYFSNCKNYPWPCYSSLHFINVPIFHGMQRSLAYYQSAISNAIKSLSDNITSFYCGNWTLYKICIYIQYMYVYTFVWNIFRDWNLNNRKRGFVYISGDEYIQGNTLFLFLTNNDAHFNIEVLSNHR